MLVSSHFSTRVYMASALDMGFPEQSLEFVFRRVGWNRCNLTLCHLSMSLSYWGGRMSELTRTPDLAQVAEVSTPADDPQPQT